MIYSNNIDAIAVPKNSKRYCVFYNDRPRLPEEFYINYHQWLDNETEAKDNGNHKNFKDGARHILYDLLTGTFQTLILVQLLQKQTEPN